MADIIPDALLNYEEYQQVYCLSAASNAVGKKTGTTKDLEAGFRTSLGKTLPQLTPVNTWKVGWGPAVFKRSPNNPNYGPLNAWFVAQNDKVKLLVVAIAGTAEQSVEAWQRDCDVGFVVDFDRWTSKWTPTNIPGYMPAVFKKGSLCSQGTCFFLKNILTYPSPSTGVATGTVLGTFLQDFQTKNPDYKIYFTGHSLGGAVSPSLALGLVQSKIIQNKNVYTMPSAGASPGNAIFTDKFVKAFPKRGSGWATCNTNAYNTLDMVPQAWCTDPTQSRNMMNVYNIYADVVPEKIREDIETYVRVLSRLANVGCRYIPLPGTEFTGRDLPPLANWDDVKVEGSYQHTTEYWLKIGITDFVTLVERSLEEQPGIKPLPEFGGWTEEDFENYAANLEVSEDTAAAAAADAAGAEEMANA